MSIRTSGSAGYSSSRESEGFDGCKGCAASVQLSSAEIAALFGETLRVRKAKLTDADTYERRLAACHSCDAFQFGTTCRWCGCLMSIKAKLSAARCPAPGGSRWPSATNNRE